MASWICSLPLRHLSGQRGFLHSLVLKIALSHCPAMKNFTFWTYWMLILIILPFLPCHWVTKEIPEDKWKEEKGSDHLLLVAGTDSILLLKVIYLWRRHMPIIFSPSYSESENIWHFISSQENFHTSSWKHLPFSNTLFNTDNYLAVRS